MLMENADLLTEEEIASLPDEDEIAVARGSAMLMSSSSTQPVLPQSGSMISLPASSWPQPQWRHCFFHTWYSNPGHASPGKQQGEKRGQRAAVERGVLSAACRAVAG